MQISGGQDNGGMITPEPMRRAGDCPGMTRSSSFGRWLTLGVVGTAATYWIASRTAEAGIDARTRERLAPRKGKAD